MLVLISTTIWFAAWRLGIIFCNDVFGLCSAINKFGGIDESNAHLGGF